MIAALCNRCKIYEVVTSPYPDIPAGTLGLLDSKPFEGIALTFIRNFGSASTPGKLEVQKRTCFFLPDQIRESKLNEETVALLQEQWEKEQPKPAVQPLTPRP